jgi:NAD(P)-dependent dehydrogenase (short-subunit alcohol dehydrogenase family)
MPSFKSQHIARPYGQSNVKVKQLIFKMVTGSYALPPRTEGPLGFFIKTQYRVTPMPIPPETTFAGKTAIVTGSYRGIGLESCKLMLQRNLTRLIMAVRDMNRGETIAKQLRSDYPKASIEVWHLDMASYTSVTTFAKRCATDAADLDIAILNVGITRAQFNVVSETGHEEHFQVNYLSTALLSFLLLPILSRSAKRASAPSSNTTKASEPGRLTIVCSDVSLIANFTNHEAVPLLQSFDNKPASFAIADATELYGTTKVLQTMFVKQLSEVVDPDKVIVNTVDPGFTRGTGLHLHLPGWLQKVFGVAKNLTGWSPKVSATTYIQAVAVFGKESHGSFLSEWRIHP